MAEEKAASTDLTLVGFNDTSELVEHLHLKASTEEEFDKEFNLIFEAAKEPFREKVKADWRAKRAE